MHASHTSITRKITLGLMALLLTAGLTTLPSQSALADEVAPVQTDTRSWPGGFTATWLIPDGDTAPTRYEVRYGTSPGSHPHSKNAGLSTQADVFASNGVTYYVVVAAIYPGGIEQISNEMTAMPVANSATIADDDFADGNYDGWTVDSGSWSAASGTLSGSGVIVTGPRALFIYAVEATVTAGSSAQPNGVVARYQGPGDYYSFVIGADDRVRILRTAGGTTTELVNRYFPAEEGVSYPLRLEVNRYTLRGFVDGEQVAVADDVTFPTGQAGIIGRAAVSADDALVTTIAPSSEDPPTANTATRKSALLSGWWNFTPAGGQTTNTRVPDCWACISPLGGSSGVYERYFQVPSNFGSRVVLEFDQVTEWATVHLNGTLIGSHKGEGLPFAFDITDDVNRSGGNLLQVEVQRGDDHWPTGWDDRDSDLGIRGHVWLRSYAEVHTQDLAIRTSVAEGELSVTATIVNRGTTSRTVDLALAASGGGSATTTFPAETGIVVAAGSSQTVTVTRDWDDARLWSPDDPYLYTLHATLVDGSVFDVATERFGFREFTVDGTDYLLNGVEYRLRGDSIISHGARMQLQTGGFQPQDYYLQWSTKARALAAIEAYQALGINVLRTHVGPATGSHFYEAADELGMLIIDESTIYGSYSENRPPTGADADGRTGVQNYTAWVESWVRSNGNHPSIVQWSIGNENPSNVAWTKTLYDAVKAVDPSRPASYDPHSTGCWPADRSDTCVLHYTAPDSHNGTGIPAGGDLWGFTTHSTTRPSAEGEFSWNSGNPSPGHAALTLAYRQAGFSDVRPYRLNRQVIDSMLPEPQYARDTEALARAMAAVGVYDMAAESSTPACVTEETSAQLVDGEITRRLLVFNDELAGTEVVIGWRLLRGTTLISEGSRTEDIPLAGKVEFDLVVPATGVSSGELLHFEFSSSKGGVDRFEHTIALRVLEEAAGQEQIIDDGGCLYADSGNWSVVAGEGYGDSYRAGTASPAKWATFKSPHVLDGEYEVWAYWVADPANSTNAQIRVYHVDGTLSAPAGAYDQFFVDQTQGSPLGEFHRIGTIAFEMDASDYVGIVSNDANGRVVVDAVKLVKQ